MTCLDGGEQPVRVPKRTTPILTTHLSGRDPSGVTCGSAAAKQDLRVILPALLALIIIIC